MDPFRKKYEVEDSTMPEVQKLLEWGGGWGMGALVLWACLKHYCLLRVAVA
jgi:hypothetical protein